MFVEFSKTDALKIYRGYDPHVPDSLTVPVNMADGAVAEVSDKFGEYLLKTYPDNFVETKQPDPPKKKTQTGKAGKGKKGGEDNPPGDVIENAKSVVETAAMALTEFRVTMNADDQAEVNLLIEECQRAIESGDKETSQTKADEIVEVSREFDEQYKGFNKFGPPQNKAQTPGENK